MRMFGTYDTRVAKAKLNLGCNIASFDSEGKKRLAWRELSDFEVDRSAAINCFA